MLSQKEKVSKALLKIKADVTKDDRINCAKHLKLAKITVHLYVNGHIYDSDTGIKILKCLKEQIKNRNQSLRKLTK